jgi:hypothetical protein
MPKTRENTAVPSKSSFFSFSGDPLLSPESPAVKAAHSFRSSSPMLYKCPLNDEAALSALNDKELPLLWESEETSLTSKYSWSGGAACHKRLQLLAPWPLSADAQQHSPLAVRKLSRSSIQALKHWRNFPIAHFSELA